MNNLEQILEMWKKDTIIDEMELDEASRDSAKLHGKYLELLSVNRLRHKKFEMDFKVLLKNKWLWYNGKLTKAEMDDLGWGYDPLNGLTVLKGDMERFYDADPDIQAVQAKIEYQSEINAALKEIIDNIKWRHSNIKNIIDWKKFTSGM